MVAIIGGDFQRFRPLIDLYRKGGEEGGYTPDQLKVGVHAMGFVAESSQEARDAFFPGWFHMVTTIGRERGWSAPSRQQFDATTGPGGAYLIGDPAYVAEKILEASDVLGGISRSHVSDEFGIIGNRCDEAIDRVAWDRGCTKGASFREWLTQWYQSNLV